MLAFAFAGSAASQAAQTSAEPRTTPSAQAAAARTAETSEFGKFQDNVQFALQALERTRGRYSQDKIALLDKARSQLAADRDRAHALAERGTLDSRVIDAQLETLGPPPAEGAIEPPSIAQRRDALNSRLGVVMEPVQRLREAEARAAVLVTEIDERTSTLKRRHLFSRGASPLNPAPWLRGVANLGQEIGKAGGKLSDRVASSGVGDLLLQLLLVLALVAAVPWLLLRAGRWGTARIERRFETAETITGRLLFAILEDALSGLLFAVMTIVIVTGAALLLAPILSIENLLKIGFAMALAGLVVGLGQWLGRSALRSPFPELRLVELPAHRIEDALSKVRRIAFVLGAEIVVDSLETFSLLSTEAAHLLSAVLVTAGSILVWQFARFFIEARKFHDQQAMATLAKDAEDPPASVDFATPISRLLRLFAILSIVAVIAGYTLLAREIFSSTLVSLAVIGMAIFLYRSIALVIHALGVTRFRRYRRMLHVLLLLIGFVMTLVTIPLLAIVWGYSAYEIFDWIVIIREGVEFGEVRISAGDVFVFAAVFFLGFFLTRWLQHFLRVAILSEFDMNAGSETAIVTFLGYIGITLAAVIAIATTGLDLSSLAFIAGALSVGLGFGLQAVVENFTSGILLLMERPIKEGDWIEVGGHSGIVRKIAVRATHIETFDRHQIIIPNSQLITEAVRNRSFTGEPARVEVPVGVAYGTDLEKARTILLDVAHANDAVLADPEPFVAMAAFGESSIDLKLFSFVSDVTQGAGAQSALLFEIARRFAKEGIDIPFPQRDLNLRSVPDSMVAKAEPARRSSAKRKSPAK